MQKAPKCHLSKATLAFALLILVAVFPVAAQEPEKQKEENTESGEATSTPRGINFTLPALPATASNAPMPEGRSTLFPVTRSVSSQRGSSDEWQFQFVPYIFFASLKGKVDVSDQEVPFEAPFRDTFEKLNFAFMMTFGARKGRWGIGTDLMYINLDTENTYSGRFVFADSQVSNRMFMLGPEVAFRVAENEKASLDILGGFRYWHNSLDVEVSGRILPPTSRSESDNWVDPLIGTRIRFVFGKGWNVTLNGDVGGFGAGSDFAWQAYGGLGKDFKKRYSFLFGYRGIGLQFDDTRALRRLTFYGPVLGVAMRFGATQ